MSQQGQEETNGGQEGRTQAVPLATPPPPVAAKRKRMKKRSLVWDHFEQFVSEEGDIKGRCLHCSRDFYCDPKKNGTSALISHMGNCKKMPASVDGRQAVLNFQPGNGNGEGNTLSNWKFDKDAIRKAVAFMIIVDELPFKFVESEGFKNLISVACPRFKIPSRWSVSRDCFKLYIDEKNTLKALLKSSNQRVCLTTNTWSSIQRINYMCLTAHFIDTDWKLNKKIINFCPISSHRGRDIGWEIEKCLHEWGIDRIFTITVDNASSNDVAISYLKDQMGGWGTSILNCQLIHMRCVAHIINLVVVDGLKEIGNSVKNIRNAVRFVRYSPARLKKFKECVEHEKITSKGLLSLDVSTRWNSTYLMLESTQKFEKAFNRFDLQDMNFRIELESDGGVPSKEDWQKARRMITFLQVFYELTVRISGSLYVTSNLFFHEIYMVNCLLKEWINSDENDLCEMARRMKEKFDKYWGDPKKMNKVIFIAVILDPRYKFDWVQFALSKMYEGDLGISIGNEVKQLLISLYNKYKKDIAPEIEQEKGADAAEQSNMMAIDDPTVQVKKMVQSEYKKFRFESRGGKSVKSEVEKYLNEETEGDEMEFDILGWWKVNSPRFHILSQMARDVLAIPISTVASESAFSTGGRVLDPFRSSLTPKVVQSLICGQDWLRKSSTPVNVEENLTDVVNLEQGLKTISLESSTDI